LWKENVDNGKGRSNRLEEKVKVIEKRLGKQLKKWLVDLYTL